MPDSGAAYGQGIVSAGSDFPPEYPGDGPTYNQMSLSIEREGYPSEEPTPIQWQRIVELNRYLAHVHQVPLDGDHIVGHYRSDHVARGRCPSTPTLSAAAYMAELVRQLQRWSPSVMLPS